MKLVFANARRCQQFAALFANLKHFTDNLPIYFSSEKVYIQCMDDSHCCLLECQLSAGWFKEYTFDPEIDQACIGVNISLLNKVLNTWSDTQEMSIIVQGDVDKIAVNFENGNISTGNFDKFFEISLVNLESELMDVRPFDTLVDLTIESKIFCSLITQLTIFDNTLTLTFNEEHIECVSSGSDGSMTARIDVDDVKEYAISENTTLKQSYSLRYVQMMCQFNKLATEMELGFSEDKPMTMKYTLGDNNDGDGDCDCESFVRIHLASKIKDDE